ncbi:DUF3515 domain-containing protein [Geodermatophilus sp. SYSU D00684]
MIVPVLVALLVLVRVVGGDDDGDDEPVADVSGAPTQQRAEDLPVLPVEVPPPTPEADAACPALMSGLPLDLTGEPQRLVDSDTPYAAAWGEPPVVLVCGVPQPAGLVAGEGLLQIDRVTWFVEQTEEATTWTAVDRAAYVQVTLPPDVDSAPVTVLSGVIADTLPPR